MRGYLPGQNVIKKNHVTSSWLELVFFFFLIEGRMISIDWFKNFIYIKLCTFS